MSLNLKVVTKKHDNAVNKDDPSIVRQIGFKVTTTLTATGANTAPSTLQEKYRLEQWVKDKYWLEARSTESSSDWGHEPEQSTDWHRDQFGEDDDLGEWNSTQTTTTFSDEPGFLGTDQRHGRALTKLQRLGDYEISFYWKVFNGPNLLLQTDVITLKAEPDDHNDVTYSAPVDKPWTVIA